MALGELLAQTFWEINEERALSARTRKPYDRGIPASLILQLN